MPRHSLRNPTKTPATQPYSLRFRSGSIGAIDGRSREARYMRCLEIELCHHLGANSLDDLPITTRLLVQQACRTQIQLEAFEAKMVSKRRWTDCDARTHSGLVNRQCRLLTTLGLDPATKPTEKLDALDIMGQSA